MNLSLRAFRRALRPNISCAENKLKTLDKFYNRSVFAIKTYYIISLVLSYQLIIPLFHRNFELASFLWPVAWMDYSQLKKYAVVIPICLFLINFAIVIDHSSRILRLLFFVFVLFTAALDLSLGTMSHPWHVWLWIAFLMMFLPSHRAMRPRAYKLATVSTIYYVQTLILLFYTMAGFGKFKAGVASLLAGTQGNFSPTGFASLLADRMLQGHGSTILGWFFVDWPYLGYPVFLALIAIQTASVVIVLIPWLHRLWGVMLIMFHFGTVLLMDIYFATHVAWLAIFLVNSPFHESYVHRVRQAKNYVTFRTRV